MVSLIAPDNRHISNAITVLQNGGLVVCPTDTLYGLAADPMDTSAVRRVIEIKGRSGDQGIPLLLNTAEDATIFAATFSGVARRLADTFWPGPLTLVLRHIGDVSDAISGGRDTVALRVPDHPIPRVLAAAMGGAITGTSANRHGAPDPLTATEVRGQIGKDVDIIIDGGTLPTPVASTIVEILNGNLRILRQGTITEAEIQRVANVQR